MHNKVKKDIYKILQPPEKAIMAEPTLLGLSLDEDILPAYDDE
jgi:hypothetical protein